MPKVYLTQGQRDEARRRRVLAEVGEALLLTKHRRQATNKELGHALGIGHVTVASILNGQDVAIGTERFLAVLDLCGLEVRKKAGREDVSA